MPARKSKQTYTPGPDLYLEVKAGFVRQGKTFTGWCKDRGVARANVTMALRGGWTGPGAEKLIEEIVKAAGLSKEAA